MAFQGVCTTDQLITASVKIEAVRNLIVEVEEEVTSIDRFIINRQNLEGHINAACNGNNQWEYFTELQNYRDALSETVTLLNNSIQKFGNQRSKFLNEMTTIYSQLSNLLDTISREKIMVWKNQQQRKLCRFPIITNDEIGIQDLVNYMENLITLNKNSLTQLNAMKEIILTKATFLNDDATTSAMNSLTEQFQDTFIRLIREAFVVETQPPQGLKTDTNLDPSSVTLLLSVNYLHEANMIMMSPLPAPQVKPWIIHEEDVQNWIQTGQLTLPAKDAFLVDTESVEFKLNESTGRFTASFSKLKIKKVIPRKSSNSTSQRLQNGTSGKVSEEFSKKRVSEEKLCMIFQTVLVLDGLSIEVTAMSFPLVCLSHHTQDDIGVATYLWDNAFSEVGRLPFQVTSTACWSQVAKLISGQFLDKTERPLTDQNLFYLKQKLFQDKLDMNVDQLVSWTSFIYTKQLGENHSYWYWIFMAIKAITKNKNTLLKIWQRGHLMGFVSSEKAEELLTGCESGTFILRFSETCPGAITVSYVSTTGQIVRAKLQKRIGPPNLKLDVEEFFNVLKWDKGNLLYLYPSKITKADAFSEFYPADNPTTTNTTALSTRKPPYVQIVPVILSPDRECQSRNSVSADTHPSACTTNSSGYESSSSSLYGQQLTSTDIDDIQQYLIPNQGYYQNPILSQQADDFLDNIVARISDTISLPLVQDEFMDMI